eukprot:7391965-Prymnesium_polylepis.2
MQQWLPSHASQCLGRFGRSRGCAAHGRCDVKRQALTFLFVNQPTIFEPSSIVACISGIAFAKSFNSRFSTCGRHGPQVIHGTLASMSTHAAFMVLHVSVRMRTTFSIPTRSRPEMIVSHTARAFSLESAVSSTVPRK